MIKESCNLIGKKLILVNNLRLYVIHEKKTSLFSQTLVNFYFLIFFLDVAMPMDAFNFLHRVTLTPSKFTPSMPGLEVEVSDAIFPLALWQ